jgi:2-phospho-L-lactate/phosphoenolpyruvate guanylyltransferase
VLDLLVPMKSLSRAKTRLRGAVTARDGTAADPRAHELLTIALARDTVAAALAAGPVRRVVVVTSDPELSEVLAVDGASILPDRPEHDLNGALRYAADELRARGGGPDLGVLQADLPALRPAELSDALDQALSAFRAGLAGRAFCADAQGEGTTLLVASAGTALDPEFGLGSAAAHERSGALRLAGSWPGLRRDVDRPADLCRAARIGLGPATRAVLRDSHPDPDCARERSVLCAAEGVAPD